MFVVKEKMYTFAVKNRIVRTNQKRKNEKIKHDYLGSHYDVLPWRAFIVPDK